MAGGAQMVKVLFGSALMLVTIFAGVIAVFAREVNHAPLPTNYYLAYHYFINDRSRFDVVRLDSTQPLPNPQGSVEAGLSSCAPNGDHLAVFSDRLHVVSAGERQQAALPFDGAVIDEVSVSNNGEALVSLAARLQNSAPRFLFYQADFAAQRLAELPMLSTPMPRFPVLAPDGQRIAMTMNSFQNPRHTNVLISDIRTATAALMIAEGWSPAWSPDGDMIAFIRQTEENYQVFIKDMRTLTEAQVTFDDMAKRWPVWSPDGQHLLYLHSQGIQSELYVVNWDSSMREQIFLPYERDISNISLESACFLRFQPDILGALAS
jgi:hypothetical protein